MKKVKFMLVAITVFAVVGGSLAFKAKKFTSTPVYITQGTPNLCNKLVNIFPTNAAGAPVVSYNTVPGTCPFTTSITTIEQ